jgi:outer membrane murein-binding lipoprotein Lpp
LQLDEMFRQVANAVENEAWASHRFKQVPYRSSSYSGSYCLAGCDDPKLADQIKDIETQRKDLTQKLEQVSRENERLKALAQSGAEEVARLEQRVARLAEEEKAKGLQSVDVGHELERARSELASVKAEQSRRDTVERENQRRIVELERLRTELQKQSVEIEEYRKRIRELEVAKEKNRGLEEASQQSRDRPQRPAVIVPSF